MWSRNEVKRRVRDLEETLSDLNRVLYSEEERDVEVFAEVLLQKTGKVYEQIYGEDPLKDHIPSDAPRSSFPDWDSRAHDASRPRY